MRVHRTARLRVGMADCGARATAEADGGGNSTLRFFLRCTLPAFRKGKEGRAQLAMLENYPTDPRQQPIRIGTAEIVFATRGPEWSEFARDRKHLAAIEFKAAPEKDANEFLNSMKNRVALVARQTLANTRPHYLISDCSVRRGSLIITLDFSVIPANITLILGTSATILYKGLKDYKTIREGTIQVYKDLSFGVTAIADKIASLYKVV